MGRIFKWLLRIFTALAALTGVVVVLGYLVAARSLPDYDEDFELAGVTEGVTIIRDTAGIPHITGENDGDVFFGLGFAHAQDRLWQMLMMRRTVQGRLSEYFGERTADTDELLRRLDLYGAAQRSVSVLGAQTQFELLSYARGVNAWLNQVNAGARGRGGS